MKKLFIILTIIFLVPLNLPAQLQIRTHKEKISDFPNKITKVVLTGNDTLDIPIREAVKNFWTISAYEICSKEEFESIRSNDNYYFLAVGGNSDGVRSWYLVKGGDFDKKKGLASMVAVADVPVCPADGYTGREEVLLPVLICNLQYEAAKAVKIKYTGVGGNISNIKKAKDLPLIVCEDELSPEIGLAEKEFCEGKGIRIASAEDADGYFYTGDQAAVCFVIGPRKPARGQTFYVYLVDSSTYGLYYIKKRKVSSSGRGVLKEDLKAFAKGR